MTTTKKTFEYFANLATNRNHTLNSVSNKDTPSKGNLEITCKTCGVTFTTSAHSYENAKKSGCSNCKAIKTSDDWKGKPRVITPEQAEKNQRKNDAKNKYLEEKRKSFAHITNRDDLIKYLKSENNEYTNFILDRIEHPPQADATNIKRHHIIPRHAGGSNKQWNLMPLTKEDHFKAHEIRARVYNEEGDKMAIHFGSPEGTDNGPEDVKSYRTGNTTRKNDGTGIYGPGVAQKGGKIGGAVKSEKKDLSHSSKMSAPVRDALYKGSSWKHRTGVILNVAAEEALTMPQLVKLLAEALPPDCEDHEKLTRDTEPVNITSALSKVIKKERPSAYGWSLND